MKRILGILIIAVLLISTISISAVSVSAKSVVPIQSVSFSSTKGFKDGITVKFNRVSGVSTYRVFYRVMDENQTIKGWTKYTDYTPKISKKVYSVSVSVPDSIISGIKARGGYYGGGNYKTNQLVGQRIKVYVTVRGMKSGRYVTSYDQSKYVSSSMADLAPGVHAYWSIDKYSCGVWVYKELCSSSIKGYCLFVRNKSGRWEKIKTNNKVSVEDEMALDNSQMVKISNFYNISESLINKAKVIKNGDRTFIEMTARGFNSKGGFCTPYAPTLVGIQTKGFHHFWDV